MIERLKRRWRYRNTWGTKLGKDCISLDCSLAEWLGQRLIFLSANAHGAPCDRTYEVWCAELRANGNALLSYCGHFDCETADEEERVIKNGQKAMRWVAKNLGTLWD